MRLLLCVLVYVLSRLPNKQIMNFCSVMVADKSNVARKQLDLGLYLVLL